MHLGHTAALLVMELLLEVPGRGHPGEQAFCNEPSHAILPGGRWAALEVWGIEHCGGHSRDMVTRGPSADRVAAPLPACQRASGESSAQSMPVMRCRLCT